MGYTLLFRLLNAMALRPNRYLTHEELLDQVWGNTRSDATIRSAIRELRNRLRRAGMGDLAEAIDGNNPGRYGLMLHRLR
jgi:DNA-binding response OmpR family regulator